MAGSKIWLVVLSGVHGLFARWVRHFATDRNTHSAEFYRIINEVPTLMMIGIVLLARERQAIRWYFLPVLVT